MSGKASLPAVLHSLVEEPADPRSLPSRVTAATSLLFTPALHSMAFRTITSGYQHLLTQYEQSSIDRDLELSLEDARSVLRTLISHCPRGWSTRTLKWIVDLFGQLCASRQPSPSLEEGMKEWLLHPALHPLSEFISRCTDHLVGMGLSRDCVKMVLPTCLTCRPHLDWMLAHVISLHPTHLVPVLLGLSLRLHPAHTPTICKTLELVSHSHADAVRSGVVKLVQDDVLRWREGGRGLRLLLRLAVMSRPFLEAVSSACLETVTPDKIQALVASRADTVPTSSALYDSHVTDQDEGEVVSEGEEDTAVPEDTDSYDEVVETLGKVICQLGGQDASNAIGHILQVYRDMSQCHKTEEEAMEEGEIVRTSPVQSMMGGCEAILAHVLHHLHVAAHRHLLPAGGGGSAVEFAVGLQNHLEDLCLLLTQLSQDPKCAQWLVEVIACVCTCSSELVAARTLSQLLASPNLKDEVSLLVHVFWRLQSRHPTVAKTAIAMTTVFTEDKQRILYDNLKTLLRLQPTTPCWKHLHSNFVDALSAHFNTLSLSLADMAAVWLLEMRHKHGLTAECQVGAHAVTQFFSLLQKVFNHSLHAGEVDIALESLIGHLQQLLSGTSGWSKEVAVFLCHSSLHSLLCENWDTQPSPTTVPAGGLLPANQSQLARTFNKGRLQNSGRLQSRKYSQTSKKLSTDAELHCTNLAVQLMANMTPPSTAQLASLLQGVLAPHAQPSMTSWPEGDSLKYTLEWELSVYRRCVAHPVVWPLFTLIAEGDGLSVCASTLHSLLMVLAQHWQRCRSRVTSSCPQELDGSIALVHCLAKARWIPPPLAYVGELFEQLTPHEVYQLLTAISTYLKEHFPATTSVTGGHDQLKDASIREVLRGILIKNIHHFGHVYARFMLC